MPDKKKERKRHKRRTIRQQDANVVSQYVMNLEQQLQTNEQ